MERQRQRRLLAELCFGPGRQRSLPDQCRRVVRELERQLAENSRLSIFAIVTASPPSSEVDRLVLKTMTVDSPKAQISGGKAAIWCNALKTTRSTLASKPIKLPTYR